MKKNWQRSACWILIVSTIVLGFTACTREAEPTNDTVTADTTAPQTPQTAYYHLVGTLAGEKVTFDLMREENSVYPEHGYFRGFYRYDRFGGPIALYGSVDSNNMLILTEQGGYNQEPHTLKGKWTEDAYTGQWFSGNGREDHPFSLQRIDTGFIVLEHQIMTDSLVAFPAWSSSPQADFTAQWLVAHSPDKALNTFIEHAIAAGLSNGEINTTSSVDQSLRLAKNAFFEDYRREMLSLYEDGLIDSTKQEGFSPFSYLFEKSVIVYFNTPELLTLGFTDYNYMGGAHGMYATTVKSYDLQQGRQVQLSEVLRPGFEAVLSDELARALRVKYQLGDDAPLSEVLFEDTLEPNENFGLTEKGIFFVYQPYEIAAYALGEIELYVSFERIRNLVQDEWLK